MKIIYTDVLVIGAGLAGLRMAVAVQRRGQDPLSCPSALRSALTLKRLRAACRPPSAT